MGLPLDAVRQHFRTTQQCYIQIRTGDSVHAISIPHSHAPHEHDILASRGKKGHYTLPPRPPPPSFALFIRYAGHPYMLLVCVDYIYAPRPVHGLNVSYGSHQYGHGLSSASMRSVPSAEAGLDTL